MKSFPSSYISKLTSPHVNLLHTSVFQKCCELFRLISRKRAHTHTHIHKCYEVGPDAYAPSLCLWVSVAYHERTQTSKHESETSSLRDRPLTLRTDAPMDGLGYGGNCTLAFMSYLLLYSINYSTYESDSKNAQERTD